MRLGTFIRKYAFGLLWKDLNTCSIRDRSSDLYIGMRWVLGACTLEKGLNATIRICVDRAALLSSKLQLDFK